MRARFAFPMQGTGRGIAAAPESSPATNGAAPPARAGRARDRPSASRGLRAAPGRATRGRAAAADGAAIRA